MITPFQALCNTLELSTSVSEHGLNQLIDWYRATVSTDCHCEGTLEKRYGFYKDKIVTFLEDIDPYINRAHVTEPVSKFNGQSSMASVVDLGLDVYLKTLRPTPQEINTPINGVTLLLLAALRGHYHTVVALLALGADAYQPLTKGDPLLCATLEFNSARDEQIKMRKQLIYKSLCPSDPLLKEKTDALLKQQTESGDTVAHVMAKYGYDDLMLKLLINHQELVHIPNNFRHYPIHEAIIHRKHECLELLLAVDVVDKWTDEEGQNAFHYAAKYGDSAMVEMCVKSALSINSRDEHDRTPLIVGVISNNVHAVQALIEAGARINETDSVGMSALHYAVVFNAVEIVPLLLEVRDLQINLCDEQEQTPLDLVHSHSPKGHEIDELLRAKGATQGRSRSHSL